MAAPGQFANLVLHGGRKFVRGLMTGTNVIIGLVKRHLIHRSFSYDARA